MSTLLDEIVGNKSQEVARAKERLPESEVRRRLRDAPPVRDFAAALTVRPGIRLIAEVKRASPSAGLLCAEFDPAAIATAYTACGASAISVLTDTAFFQGSLEHLSLVRNTVTLPVMRKDFVLDPYQVLEARMHGADAVLLIAEILPGSELVKLLHEIHGLGMEALVEFFEPEQLHRVIDSGARVVGVNNRNLHTFETNLDQTILLAPSIPTDRILVSESGIRTRADVLRLEAAGARAILVGETLMRAPNIELKIDELLGH